MGKPKKIAVATSAAIAVGVAAWIFALLRSLEAPNLDIREQDFK